MTNDQIQVQRYKRVVNDFIATLEFSPKKDQRQKEDAENTVNFFASLLKLHGVENDKKN